MSTETATIRTEYRFCPNPEAISFNTNWNIRNHPSLQFIIENVEGVEDTGGVTWGLHKYNFLVIIGAMFDREQVAQLVLQKIGEYFSES